MVGSAISQTTEATIYLCWAKCDLYDCTIFSYAAASGLCTVYLDPLPLTPETGTDVYVPSTGDSCASLTFAPTSAPTPEPTAFPSVAPSAAPTRRPTAVGETEPPTVSPSDAPTAVS